MCGRILQRADALHDRLSVRYRIVARYIFERVRRYEQIPSICAPFQGMSTSASR